MDISEDIRGLVFDIEEFAVYDGPGIRCAVFLKGCPLRCMWCHNPEGLSAKPQRVITHSLCVHCGACEAVCPKRIPIGTVSNDCVSCGACVKACPKGCIRIAGTSMTASEVAAKVKKHEKLLKLNGGGVTFSGGEVLLQPDFVIAVRKLLPQTHALIETSGFSTPKIFQQVASVMNMVIMDIKLADPIKHKHYTGVDNAPILNNLQWLKHSGIPFRIRIPLIPSVNDSLENMEATAVLLKGADNLEMVELLRYNKAAGAKYASIGMQYAPTFPTMQEPNIITEPFERLGIHVRLL